MPDRHQRVVFAILVSLALAAWPVLAWEGYEAILYEFYPEREGVTVQEMAAIAAPLVMIAAAAWLYALMPHRNEPEELEEK